MRHSEVTGLQPANDNPKPAEQADLFGVREIVIGPTSIGERVKVLGQHVDGLLVVHEILDRGDGPVAVVA